MTSDEIALENMQALEQQAQLQGLERQEEEAARQEEAANVSPLDLDFFPILLLAVGTDALDIILELTSFFVVPKLLGIVLDVFGLVIGFWLYWRTKRKVDVQHHREMMQEQISQRIGQKAGRLQGQLATTRNPLRRVWLKTLSTFLLEILPFVGLLPMWTITVIGALRKQ